MIDVINRKLAALVLPSPLGDLLDRSPNGQLVQLGCRRESQLDAHVFASSAARTPEGPHMHFVVRPHDLHQISCPVVCGSATQLAPQHKQLLRRRGVMHQAVTEPVRGGWDGRHFARLEQNTNLVQGCAHPVAVQLSRQHSKEAMTKWLRMRPNHRMRLAELWGYAPSSYCAIQTRSLTP